MDGEPYAVKAHKGLTKKFMLKNKILTQKYIPTKLFSITIKSARIIEM